MWDWLLAHLPELERGKVEVRDVANLLVAFAGAILAGLAIVMAKRQEKLTDQLLNVAGELKALTAARERERQAEAKRKHQLDLTLTFRSIETSDNHRGWQSYFVHVVNNGNKKSDAEVDWSIGIDRDLKDYITVFPYASHQPIEYIDRVDVHRCQFGCNEKTIISPGYAAKNLFAYLYVNPAIFAVKEPLPCNWTTASGDIAKDGTIYLKREPVEKSEPVQS